MGIKDTLRKNLKGSNAGARVWKALHNANVSLNGLLSDKAYFEKAYKRTHGCPINWKNPTTFDEKQIWMKMFYRNDLATVCSDKLLVRDYVKQKGLEEILNPMYASFESAESIDWDSLPKAFYMKANNGSATNMRCNDIATFDKAKAEKFFAAALKQNYYRNSREWNYKDIKPRIIAEKIIDNCDSLADYRFLCGGGKCEYVFIDIDTADENGKHKPEARRNVYDRDMNLLDVQVSRGRFPEELVKKPENWDKMVEYAERLADDFPFCRVDLYNNDGEILFGEITFFHAGGLSTITPSEWEKKLGSIIELPEPNYNLDVYKSIMNGK